MYLITEKFDLNRANYWSGLRLPNVKKNGYNWTIYYCLLYTTKNSGPLDIIMYLINEYLNWMPAGSWKNPILHNNNCPICWCGCWGGDINLIPISFCSYECLEKQRRIELFNEWDQIVNIMNSFALNPQDAIDDLEFILGNFNEYLFYNAIPYNYSDSMSSDLYDDYDYWE